LEDEIMDKDRVVGSTKQVEGAVKQSVGRAVGDAKLESEGQADKVEGKIQNASKQPRLLFPFEPVPTATNFATQHHCGSNVS
jgi:uncharacterized protein YjbJ (UPF0337 family)